LAEAWEWFRVKWQVGGPTMWALGFAALVAVVFAVDRIIGLRRGRIVPHGLADQANRLWLQGQYDQVRALGERSRSTLGEIIVFLVEHRSNSYEHLTAAAEDIAARDFERHARGNYPLVAVGTLSPLLGLLGTVLGLFGAFSTIGVVGSMDDPSALAGDIGEAIITTVAGLMIAIPSVSLYHYFYHRTSQFAVILGAEVSNLMHGWFLKKEDADARQG
jgi:biopolymer transport protein ExbB